MYTYLVLPVEGCRKYLVEHLKEISRYNNNYYEIMDFGDWSDVIRFWKRTIVYEVFSEEENSFFYYLGFFDENNKFEAVFSIEDGEQHIFEQEKTYEEERWE